MDKTTERLVDFAMNAEFAAISPETVHECKRRLIDAFASAIAAYDEPLSRVARALARRYAGCAEAGIWGSSLQTTMEAAAFANGVMLRYLDISDTYLSKSRGHPSDMLSGILAVADHLHADGPSVINAAVLAYDVYCSFADSVDINSEGWDQPVYAILGGVVGAGRLMSLSREQMANAVSLALTPNMALLQTRHGVLSSWKGCAGPNASRNAVFAALLAKEGFTGPADVFEGQFGLWNVVRKFEWKLPAGKSHMIAHTHIKSLPVCYHGQSTVLCALEMRPRVRLQDINEIHIESYGAAVRMMGGDANRWAPATRETADHSMPYVVSIAFIDGKVTAQSFAPERLADPAVRDLMRKVKVSESAELSAQYPEGAPSRLSVHTASGEVLTTEVRYPKGHARSPMNDGDVEQKFRDMFQEQGDARQCEAALQALRNFERVKDVKSGVIKLFAVRSGAAD